MGSGESKSIRFVMPGLVPGIHVFLRDSQDVDGRDKPGHDGLMVRHARPCAWHPRLSSWVSKTWMAGTSPAMTELMV